MWPTQKRNIHYFCRITTLTSVPSYEPLYLYSRDGIHIFKFDYGDWYLTISSAIEMILLVKRNSAKRINLIFILQSYFQLLKSTKMKQCFFCFFFVFFSLSLDIVLWLLFINWFNVRLQKETRVKGDIRFVFFGSRYIMKMFLTST